MHLPVAPCAIRSQPIFVAHHDAAAIRTCSLVPRSSDRGTICLAVLGKSTPFSVVSTKAPTPSKTASHVSADVTWLHRRSFCCTSAYIEQQSVSSYEDDSITPSTKAFSSDITSLELLLSSMRRLPSWEAKVWRLHEESRVAAFFQAWPQIRNNIELLSIDEQYVLACTVAIGQEHVLTVHPPEGGALAEALQRLAQLLLRVEKFYDSMGGIIGYQLKSLQLIAESCHPERLMQSLDRLCKEEPVCYLVPHGLDLAGPDGGQVAQAAALDGLEALPEMAEIYPVGGAGDRLGLKCELTGESLPAALLMFGGHTMLENLIRDLQAREYLYYKLTGRQVTTPVAIMTSDAKGNHRRISNLLESLNWMGRGEESFRLFRQPLVPVMCVDDGKWLLKGPLQLAMKPGGHGVIWKLMQDEGVFTWLEQQQRRAAILRQVSNPMAGVDTTLLALAGTGHRGQKVFGFMSCERAVGAAEGMNVLVERRKLGLDHDKGGYRTVYNYNFSNIEYTEFEKLGISDESRDGEGNKSVFPANTNILYVGLPALSELVKRSCSAGGQRVLPGLIFNMKKKILYKDPLTGSERAVRAGRMECTMQNAADWFTDDFLEPLAPDQVNQLSTFIVQNVRSKVTSSAKKKREVGSTKIRQTPDGALYDLISNAWHLLRSCGMECVPQVSSVEDYLAAGPDFLFFYHPALGPMWNVISQKIRGGSLARNSELVLEVAEADFENVHIQGSLLIQVDQVMGHFTPQTDASTVAPSAHAPGTPSALNLTPTESLPAATSSLSSFPSPPSSLLSLASPSSSSPAFPASPSSSLNSSTAGSSPPSPHPPPDPFQPSHAPTPTPHDPPAGSSRITAPAHPSSTSPSFPPTTATQEFIVTDAGMAQDPTASNGGANGGANGAGLRRRQVAEQAALSRGAGDPSTPVCGDHSRRNATVVGGGVGQRVVYSGQCGRVRMVNVRVVNRGVEWDHPDNVFWKHQVVRQEACQIILRGRSEFLARDVTLDGGHIFEVPDNHRMLVSTCPETGTVRTELLRLNSDKPSWEWVYVRHGGERLELVREEHY